MKYPGSKNRLSKHLLPIILQNRKDDEHLYVEPFVGGCNLIDKVTGNRWGNDSNHYVIEMWKALQNGWKPPKNVSEELYYDIKKYQDVYEPELVAFVAINCSFAGKWWGGYARNKKNDNYALRGHNNIMKQVSNILDVKFTCMNYLDMNIPDGSVIYCDPPYKNTIKYKDDFDHDVFWEWCRKKSKNNYLYVSEFEAPKDFECLWSKERKIILNNVQDKNHKIVIEKLFVKRS